MSEEKRMGKNLEKVMSEDKVRDVLMRAINGILETSRIVLKPAASTGISQRGASEIIIGNVKLKDANTVIVEPMPVGSGGAVEPREIRIQDINSITIAGQ